MKHTLSTSDITILEHIFHVAVKSAKIVQFCFKKGKQQSYITPKKDLYVTFELSSPIKFDYPIADLKTFLGEASWDLNSSEIKDDINLLILPSEKDDKDFQTKIVQELDYTLDDHKIKFVLFKSKLTAIQVDIATLKVKAGVWGGIAGLVPVVLGLVLFFVTKVQ